MANVIVAQVAIQSLWFIQKIRDKRQFLLSIQISNGKLKYIPQQFFLGEYSRIQDSSFLDSIKKMPDK